ncbi:TetR/AcrR family transcriptional regulator, partial [Lactobacillus parabuchneri]|nr:TetR/AcrR family transcriptional regulator [Lentilactobacillus parabuchneri]
PRATFYNYFDDKYDLLNYCWYVIAQEIQVDQAPEAVSNKSLIIYFDRLYDVFKSHAQLLNNILQYNDFSGQLGNSFINYFKNKMQEIFTTSIDYSKLGLPVELVADHCSETVILVLKWIFLKHQVA